MAFELPFPPFPHDSRGVPFIATPDDNNGYAVPSSQYFKKLVGDKYVWTPVSADDPMPTGDATAQGKLADILAKISADPATQTTLAAILAKIIAAPATEAKQTALNALIGEVQAAPTANTLLARLKNLETKVDAIIADGIKLSGRNVEVKKTTLDVSSTIVEPGQTVYFEFVVPPKELWTIQEIDFVISGIPDSTGTHTVIIQYDRPGTSSAGLQLALNEGVSSTKNLTYRFGEFETAGTSVKPTDKAALALACKGRKMTSDFVVYFRYINSSNKAHNGLKMFALAYEKEVMS